MTEVYSLADNLHMQPKPLICNKTSKQGWGSEGKETKSAWPSRDVPVEGQRADRGTKPHKKSPVQLLGLLQAPESWSSPSGSHHPRAVKPHLHNAAAVSAGMPRGTFSLAIIFTLWHTGHSERNRFHFKSFKNQKLCNSMGSRHLFRSAIATTSIYTICAPLPLLQSRRTFKAGNLV